nr:MAG TPA: hypothetical protein [Crassvirales sp.]
MSSLFTFKLFAFVTNYRMLVEEIAVITFPSLTIGSIISLFYHPKPSS